MTTYKVALSSPLEGKIPTGDPRWGAFNASFRNVELTSNDIAAALYDGCPITTWHKNNWRKIDNYICGQHIGLDFDSEDQKSTIPALMKDPFIKKYASIVYTTPTHRPDAPRTRAIFLLDTPIMQAKNYVAAASALLQMYGSADRQCKDAVRFFYGGKPGACEMEWMENTLPVSLIKDMIARVTTRPERKRTERRDYPAGTADQQRVMDALHHINPWSIDYGEWVSILMALHTEYSDPLDRDAGLPIAEAWADGVQDEVRRKWYSFKRDGNISGRVGIGTVFAIAKQHGWSN